MIKKIKEEVGRHKLIVFPAFSGLVSILMIVFVIFPHILSIIETDKVLNSTKEKNNALIKKLDTLKQIDKAVYVDNTRAALLSIPADKDVAEAISQITFLLASNSLTLDSMVFSGGNQSESSKNVDNYRLTLSIAGETSSLKDFILKIISVPRLMRITHLEVVGGRASGTIQATVALTVFFQPLPSSIGNIEQPVSVTSEDELALLAKIKDYQKNIPLLSTPNLDGSSDITGPKGKLNPFE